MDPLAALDERRLRAARRKAALRLETIDEIYRAGQLLAFREELAATVRCASPLLIDLLDRNGLSLDEVCDRFQPRRGWPRRVPASLGKGAVQNAMHTFRHYYVMPKPPSTASQLRNEIRHVASITLAGFQWANVLVVGHSLEFSGRIGPVVLETRSGVLSVEFDVSMPETLAAACIGHPIDAIVDHVALRRRGWVVTGVEDARGTITGQTLEVAVGPVDYRLPWVSTGLSRGAFGR